MLTDVVLSCFAADHPKSEEYFSDPRLAAYAVPHRQAVAGYNMQFSIFHGLLWWIYLQLKLKI